MNRIATTSDIHFIQTADKLADTGIAKMKSGKIEGSKIGIDDDTHENNMASFLTTLSDIWEQMLLLSRKLRDVMQFYNQQKQEQSWNLQLNVLQNKEAAIESSYKSALTAGICGMVGAGFGVAGIGTEVCGYHNLGSGMGTASSSLFGGVGQSIAAKSSRESEQMKALAALQEEGSHNYDKTLDDTLLKAREFMQQIMDIGRKLTDLTGQTIHTLSSSLSR